MFHDLIANFVIPLYVYLVYSLSFISFGGLGSFLTFLLTYGAVVYILKSRELRYRYINYGCLGFRLMINS